MNYSNETIQTELNQAGFNDIVEINDILDDLDLKIHEIRSIMKSQNVKSLNEQTDEDRLN